MLAKLESIKSKYAAVKQSHVFKFFDALSQTEKEALLTQLDEIDVEKVLSTYKLTIASAEASKAALKPLPVTKLWNAPSEQRSKWQQRGLDLIQKGKVGFLLLAGGQGTRLGTSDPKGCYDIGLPSHKPLFQLVAERIRRLRSLAQADKPLPWYVMTSPMTDAATKDFFRERGYFGLDAGDVVFFQQGTLPCISNEGDVLMESKSVVASAPDGNGGIYRALEVSGALEDMRRRGLLAVHVSSVDNALVLPADPLFVGYCEEAGADCGAKVVSKAGPDEAVGVLVCADSGAAAAGGKGNGGAQVVEYSEMDPAVAREVDAATGELRFNAGNICNHYYTVDFLALAASLSVPYHLARKKIPSVDEQGNTATPAANNGVKLEQFIFDVFPHATNFVCAEVLREDEFAPVKNAPGAAADSPDTARKLLLDLGRRYVEAAGGKVEGGGGVEVSPLVSFSGEGLAELLAGTGGKVPALSQLGQA